MSWRISPHSTADRGASGPTRKKSERSRDTIVELTDLGYGCRIKFGCGRCDYRSRMSGV